MKFLYFGTICSPETYMPLLEEFRIKPSIAPFVFETALLNGMRENGADVEVISFPAIPAYPKSKHLAWGYRKETLESGYRTTWIGAVNISGIKQLCQRVSSQVLLKKWLKENRNEEKAVLIYSAYQPVSKSIVTLCKKDKKTRCYAIIPDLPRDMYALAKVKSIKKALAKLYVHAAEKVQGQFDGYIYLTRAMAEVINPEKPFAVVEGIADVNLAKPVMVEEKEPGFVVMYAGALYEKYGIKNLLEAFGELNRKDAQLWLFGSGDLEGEIKRRAAEDPRIHYFGRVSREQVLEYERKASVLVNVRDGNDEFTKYSFPSKTIEYMLSGTPVLMTRLPGVPKEYDNYLYCMDDNRVETLHQALEMLGSKLADELLDFGAKAQTFVVEQKNARVQAKKMLDFVRDESILR